MKLKEKLRTGTGAATIAAIWAAFDAFTVPRGPC